VRPITRIGDDLATRHSPVFARAARSIAGLAGATALIGGAFAVGAGALAPSAAAAASARAAAPTAAEPAASTAIMSHTVTVSDAEMFYRESGRGRPVLYVHALLLDSRLWLDQLAAFPNRRNLAPDLPGFGWSSPVVAPKVDTERHAARLIEFLDRVGAREPVDVVGLSGGGTIAAMACAAAPQRCRSLVMISTPLGAALDPAGVRYRAENARTVVIEGKDTLFRRFNEYIVGPNASLLARARYKSMLEQTPYESIVAFMTTQEPPRTDLASRLPMPVMIPVGDGDTVLTPANAEALAKSFPDARVVRLPVAGRLLPLEAPAELSRALEEFWMQLDKRGSKP
jgi:pimeloyl-ACP methyl ester carboxylesterase